MPGILIEPGVEMGFILVGQAFIDAEHPTTRRLEPEFVGGNTA